MKTWKITNTSTNKQNIKVSMILNNTVSKGLILKHEEFCLAKPQITASLDMQEKRGFITIDRNFDNSKFNLTEGVSYPENILSSFKINTKITMEEAEKNATEYIQKSK